MWPFTSSSGGKDASELTKELPDNLKQFFNEVNPEPNHQSIFEISPHQKRVNEVLKREDDLKRPYDDEFYKYKQTEKAKKACSINCSEVNSQILECFKNWNYTSFDTPCSKEIAATTKCLEVQKNAFKKLHYDECISIKQCNQIRYIIDKMFTENFGQLGNEINDQTHKKFDQDLDKVFWKIWR
ncbi:hypothetical protein DFJ63DRAFT_310887 [Scheffersomyces coipomensis]|uniref:uncharacterized protein n=1 Tax=Scheffersomyces coipomensis TaxID=1788519 RepID=UPI00315CC7F3